jgi:alkaline phosphatase D
MERREFAKLLAAGTVGWLVGARAATADSTASYYPNPVPFVGELDGIDADHVRGLFEVNAARTAALQSATYPQSVASGDPQPHGIVLWTRVPAPQLTAECGTVIAWQIATSADFDRDSLVLEGVGAIHTDRDMTVKLPIAHHALRPYTIHYYRFIYNGIATRTGRFKTLPARDSDIQQLRIGYVVCQDFSNGFYTALGHLAQEEVDVVVHLGDYIYEYLDDGAGGPNNGSVRVMAPYPSGGQYPQSLADYRHLWQHYRADPYQRAVHERFAYILLWDDHEFYNDCHQDYHEDTLPAGDTALTPFPALRQAANQAWCEHGLADVTFDPTKDWSSSVQPSVYRTFHFGKLMDLIVTDERLYRDGPPCGDVDIGERYETLGCANQFSPARTMLGATQKTWFLDQVTKSKATWKLWANEVMLAQYILGQEVGGKFETFFFDLDQWDGYPVERAALFTAIGNAGVTNFVALTGDAHLFQAAYLKPDFNSPTSPVVGVEFLVGAISSGNYLDAGIDQPAPFTPAKSVTPAALKAAGTKLPMDALEALVLELNPHITFWNGSTWGYGLINLTPQEMILTFRAVQTVKQETSPVEDLAVFKVPNGQAKIIPLSGPV